MEVNINLDVVVVSYNRLEKLKTALSHYDAQTAPFRNLILVNNCSTDGTTEFIGEWERIPSNYNKIIINTSENIGGSGGFYLGQKKAIELGADWVFIADDDAYPDANLFSQFYTFNSNHCDCSFSAICAEVLTIDGEISLAHRTKCKMDKGLHFIQYDSPIEDYSKEFFNIDFLSYVGPFISVAAMRKIGLVNPDYFIFYDDTEHSFRLRKYGKIICVPQMKVIHDNNVLNLPKVAVSWRDYYLIRNKRHMLLKHMPIALKLKMTLSFIFKIYRSIPNKQAFDKVYYRAIKDATLGRLGKHPIYKPGWSIPIQ